MDIIHATLKQVDYNRYTMIGVCIFLMLFGFSRCAPYDGRVASPTTGEMVDGDQLEAEAVQVGRSLQQRWDAAEARRVAAAEEQRSIAAESESLDQDFQRAAEQIAAENEQRSQLIGKVGEIAIGAINGATGGWSELLLLGLGAITTGALVDNRRKDVQIKQRDQKLEATTGTTTV